MTIGLGLLIASVIFYGCGKSDNNSSGASPASSLERPGGTSTQSQSNTVELSQSNLNAIKIEPVGTYRFPIEMEAVGSITFDEDPAIVQAQSTLIAAQATLDSSAKELERVKSLGESNGIAPKEMEQAVAAYQTAAAALKAARDAVRAMGITDAEIDKLIVSGKIEPPSGAASTNHWAVASVAETDSPLLRAGQTVQVKTAALPDRIFDGTVSRIYGTIDPIMHRVTVRCALEDTKDELRPGMIASVIIRVQEPVEATALPVEGVVRESDGTMTAWITTDQKHFTQKIIKTGLRKDGQVQILDGLERGELAVTEGAVFLSNLLNAPPTD